jgi:hypothetical protein
MNSFSRIVLPVMKISQNKHIFHTTRTAAISLPNAENKKKNENIISKNILFNYMSLPKLEEIVSLK